jgi:phage terminase Nu1 subunit (DNA packaging protein)
MAEKARIAKFERLQIEGKLITVEEITSAWGVIVTTVRTRLLGIPTRLAGQTAAVTNPQEMFKLITDALHDALTQLASFDSRHDYDHSYVGNDGEMLDA